MLDSNLFVSCKKIKRRKNHPFRRFTLIVPGWRGFPSYFSRFISIFGVKIGNNCKKVLTSKLAKTELYNRGKPPVRKEFIANFFGCYFVALFILLTALKWNRTISYHNTFYSLSWKSSKNK